MDEKGTAYTLPLPYIVITHMHDNAPPVSNSMPDIPHQMWWNRLGRVRFQMKINENLKKKKKDRTSWEGGEGKLGMFLEECIAALELNHKGLRSTYIQIQLPYAF